MNKKFNANVSSIKFDSFYILTKGTNGVHAKFIGAPGWAQRRKPFGYQRAWSLTLEDPNKFGYLKRFDLVL
jgi:hypothetical protein